MTAFVTDSFTGTDNTALTSHTGELGATWTKHPTMAGNALAPKIVSNQLVPAEVNGSVNAFYYASGVPTTPDYSATMDFKLSTGANGADGIGMRMSTSAGDGYFATLYVALNRVSIFKAVGGSLSEIASVSTGPLDTAVTYRVTVGATGTSIRARVQRLSDSYFLTSSNTWQVGAADCVTVTDSSVTAAGRVAIWMGENSLPTTFDNLTADDPNASAGTVVTPGAGTLTVTGYAPTVAQNQNQYADPGVGALSVTGYAPSISQSALGTLTTPPLRNNTTTLQSSLTGLVAHVTTTTGTLVVSKTGQTTSAGGVMTTSDALITPTSSYLMFIVDPATGAHGCTDAIVAT